jgi:alkaline phosphatase
MKNVLANDGISFSAAHLKKISVLLILFFSVLLSLFLYNRIVWSQEPPNIILLIGDGMGLTQISAGMYANDNSTVLEEFEYIGLSKTSSSNKLVTDSAASGTAMATGVKTLNGVLGISSKNVRQKSILEICQDQGYSTALIATSSVVHATPASFYAKEDSRYNYENIALQLSKHSVDIFAGGGSKHFMSRKDKKNLIKEMSDYTFVKSITEFEKSKASKIGYFTYFDEPPSIIEGRSANLDKLTKITLDKLHLEKKPFFIMIEGSQIDWGGHDNNLKYVTSEFKDFNAAIQEALNFAKYHGNTLVVVTADHETGGLALLEKEKNRVFGKFNTEGHSATMVPVFSFGPNAESFKGIYENTEIFEKLKNTLK